MQKKIQKVLSSLVVAFLMLTVFFGLGQAFAVPVEAQSANENILYNILPSCENAPYSTESWGLCIREIVNWFFYIGIAIFFARVVYIGINSLFSDDRASAFKKMREAIAGLIIGVIFIGGPAAILNLINPSFSQLSFSALSEFASGDSLIEPTLPEKECSDQCQDYSPFDSYYATQLCTVSCQKSPENASYYKGMFPEAEVCETTPEYRSCEAGCRSASPANGLNYFNCVIDNCDLSTDESKQCLGLCDPQNQYYLGDENCQRNASLIDDEEEDEEDEDEAVSTRVVWQVNTDVFALFPACSEVGQNQEEFVLCIRQVTNFLLVIAIVIFFVRIVYLLVIWIFSFGGAKQAQAIKQSIPDLIIGVILVGMPATIMFLINPTANLLSFQFLSEFSPPGTVLVDVTPPDPPENTEEENTTVIPSNSSSDAQLVDFDVTLEEGETSVCDWGGEFNSCSQRCTDTFGLGTDKYSPKCFEACRYALPDELGCGGLPTPCTYGPFEKGYSQCIFSCGAGSDIDTCISLCKSNLSGEAIDIYNSCTQEPYN